MSTRVATLVAAAGLLAACGSDRAATMPQQSTEPPAAAATPAPTVSSEQPRTKALTKARARRALLTVKDMPTGYAAEDPQPASTAKPVVTPARCAPLVNDRRGSTLAETAFSQGGLTGARLFEEIIVPEQGVSPRQRITAIETLLADCPKYTVKDTDGTSTVKVSALSFPELGDYTLAVRAAIAVSGFTVQGDVIYVAIGGSFVKVTTSGVGDVLTGEQLEQVVRAATSKLQSAS